jgi:hypothetical protein
MATLEKKFCDLRGCGDAWRLLGKIVRILADFIGFFPNYIASDVSSAMLRR